MASTSQDLIVLTSPPASGKTYWISSLTGSLIPNRILVVSPLRALADECRNKWQETVIVMTPEEWLTKKVIADVVIFDEFHLLFYWGDTFRPIMWEVFYTLSQHAHLSVLLTATLSLEMQQEVSNFQSHFDSITWIDHGNQTLKYLPDFYIKAPSSGWMLRQIETEPMEESVKLIFCQYREEVLALERKLMKLGYSCVSCIGGESKFMKDKLQKNPSPDFIISTTVLSHGVNLPDIRKIFFLYKVENLDFWIQMVARGGRRGESYQVFALERPHVLPWYPVQNFFKVQWLTLKQNLSLRSISL
ncbi:MAG: helicase-related protein [Bacteriovoracia bacterium]